MNTPVKWVAELAHVREVSLCGRADLGYWKDRLAREDLIPAEQDGNAQILIIAADMKFRGIRFREIGFSVLVRQPHDGTGRTAAFLTQAFNSNRFFAFSERVFFSTPYDHGDIRLSTAVPCSVKLIRGGDAIFQTEMQSGGPSSSREPARSEDDGWEGPIFLPGGRSGKKRPDKVFFGKLRGHTRTYPFLPGQDMATIKPSPGCDILQALLDSHFAISEWIIREDASHAKSKTYRRSEVELIRF